MPVDSSRKPPRESGPESLVESSQVPPVESDRGSTRVSSREPQGASSWARAVKLRDAARVVILAQCGEPDLGARHDVLDTLRKRKREEGME